MRALGLPPLVKLRRWRVLAFFHLAKSCVAVALKVVNSGWSKMVHLMSAAAMRSRL